MTTSKYIEEWRINNYVELMTVSAWSGAEHFSRLCETARMGLAALPVLEAARKWAEDFHNVDESPGMYSGTEIGLSRAIRRFLNEGSPPEKYEVGDLVRISMEGGEGMSLDLPGQLGHITAACPVDDTYDWVVTLRDMSGRVAVSARASEIARP